MEPAPLLNALGLEVRARRKNRGWTRRELAQESGISERFLADVESGRANPSIARLHRLAEVFDVSTSALIAAAENAARSPSTDVVTLLGLRGAGKSSVGARLAEQLEVPFIELDQEIERMTGLRIGQIFELNGEATFRRAERDALRALLTDGPRPCILATGGGIVTDEETFSLLKERTFTVWLQATPEQHWQRVVAQGDTRPMAGQDAAFDALCAILSERERHYAESRVTVDTTGRTVDEIADELSNRFASGTPVAR